MGDLLIMSAKERQRKVILEGVKDKRYTLVEASKKMNLSYRHAKRIWANFLREGDAGLIHKHRGRVSPRAYSATFKNKVTDLYQTKYEGFGPTLASEKLLEEDNITTNVETLRRWLKEAGLWKRKRQRKPYRQRRTRRSCFGELLQMDGSDHQWFSNKDERQCLIDLVDDATGKVLAGLHEGETTFGVLTTLRSWVERYGVPCAIYVDLKNVYVSPKRFVSASDDVKAEDTWSVFERVCQRLDIEIIRAYSPQAKGRVERKHAVFQDRFVKELALKSVDTLDGANAILENGFIDKLNAKFAKPPKDSKDAHRDVEPYGDLDQIFCWEFLRQVKNDWTIQFKNQHYQLLKQAGVKIKPKQKVLVRKHLDESLSMWFKESCLEFKAIDPPVKELPVKLGYDPIQRSRCAKKNKHKSPWNQFNPGWLNSKQGDISNVEK